MSDQEGAADAVAEGADASGAESSQDTISRSELNRAIKQRDKAKAERAELASKLEAMQAQIEDLSASDSTKAAQLLQAKAEKLEKALVETSGQLANEQRARTLDKMFSHVAKSASAEEDIVSLAWDGLVASGALDDALEDGDADAALKALKKKAPSLFTERRAPKSGVLLPDGPTSYDPAAAAKEAEDVILKTQGRRVKNLMAGS